MGDPTAASNSLDHQPEKEEEKSPNMVERSKEEMEAYAPHHHKETHGKRDEIDEDTPVDEVRAPNVFERIKEEVEAIAESVHHKKESETNK